MIFEPQRIKDGQSKNEKKIITDFISPNSPCSFYDNTIRVFKQIYKFPLAPDEPHYKGFTYLSTNKRTTKWCSNIFTTECVYPSKCLHNILFILTFLRFVNIFIFYFYVDGTTTIIMGMAGEIIVCFVEFTAPVRITIMDGNLTTIPQYLGGWPRRYFPLNIVKTHIFL